MASPLLSNHPHPGSPSTGRFEPPVRLRRMGRSRLPASCSSARYGGIMLRKQIIEGAPAAPPSSADEIDIAAVATVLVTSEAPPHPVDHAFDRHRGRGGTCWMAGDVGDQTLALAFDAPQAIRQSSWRSRSQRSASPTCGSRSGRTRGPALPGIPHDPGPVARGGLPGHRPFRAPARSRSADAAPPRCNPGPGRVTARRNPHRRSSPACRPAAHRSACRRPGMPPRPRPGR